MSEYFTRILRCVLPFLLLVLTLTGVAQTPTQDSLLRLHLDETLPDSTRINAFLDSGDTNYRSDSLLIYHQAARELFDRSGEAADLVRYTFQLGRIHWWLSEFSEAMVVYEQAATMATEIGDTAMVVSALINKGNCYAVTNDYIQAVETYNEALLLAEQIDDQSGLYRIKGNLGNLHVILEDYEKGRSYFQECLIIAQESEDTKSEYRCLMNIGGAYGDEGNHEKALEYFQDGYAVAEKAPAVWGMLANATVRLGKAYYSFGNLDEAKVYLFRALNLLDERTMLSDLAGTHLCLAQIYQATNPDSYLYYANKSLEMSEKLGFLDNQAISNRLLYELHKERGQYQLALDFQSQWKTLSDSIARQDNKRALYQAEARFEYEKQKLADQVTYEQELTQQELSAQRRFYFLLAAAILTIFAFISIMRYRGERAKLE